MQECIFLLAHIHGRLGYAYHPAVYRHSPGGVISPYYSGFMPGHSVAVTANCMGTEYMLMLRLHGRGMNQGQGQGCANSITGQKLFSVCLSVCLCVNLSLIHI